MLSQIHRDWSRCAGTACAATPAGMPGQEGTHGKEGYRALTKWGKYEKIKEICINIRKSTELYFWIGVFWSLNILCLIWFVILYIIIDVGGGGGHARLRSLWHGLQVFYENLRHSRTYCM